jgi:hypothetical protein
VLAYTITYVRPPSASNTALLRFTGPKRRPGYIPRDYAMTAETQAENLARATKGFVAFGRLDDALDKWIYIANGANDE